MRRNSGKRNDGGKQLNELTGDNETLDELAEPQASRRGRLRGIAGGAALVLIAAGGGLWLAREPVADSFLARELAARGVQGTYEITRIGPRRQRLERVVIGDPRHPDLTVRSMDLEIGWGLTGPYIDRLQAVGVRLRGRLHDGALDLGQVNRLMAGGAGEAKLPTWLVVVEDAEAEITTDYGAVVMGLDGRGPLQSGFSGRLNVTAPALALGDCQLGRLGAPLDIATENERILLKGQVFAPQLHCEGADVRLLAPELDINLRTTLTMEEMGGAVTLQAASLRQAGRRLDELSGLITFTGGLDELRGSMSVAAGEVIIEGLESDAAKLGGSFVVSLKGRDRALAWQGMATVENARPPHGLDLAGLAGVADGSPVGPLAMRLARAVEAIGKSNRIEFGGQVNMLGDRGNARLDRLALTSASGARIENWEGSVVRLDWPGQLRASGRLDMVGGGLPQAQFEFATNAQGGISGTATIEDYGEGDSRLALTPVRFTVDARGRGRVQTVATLDGRLPGGAVRGLNMPINMQLGAGGAISLANSCVPLRWASLEMSGLVLDPTALQVCGVSGGNLAIDDIALKGRLGESDFAFKTASARYALASGRFELAQPDVRIGAGESPVRLAATRIGGGSGSAGGFAGTIENGHGRIATVPLDLSELGGQWSFAQGKLTVVGQIRVADTQADRRFNPLTAQSVHLTMADSRINATGVLIHPARGARVAGVTISHNLANGVGKADLALDGLRFGNAIQPDDLTPLALGVVANVEGVVEGKGQIRWTDTDVTSDGIFSTQKMSLAAAFGPVTGLSTTIHFADLLGLRTEPGQVATVDSVNPGIDVRDGTVRYALLSNEQAVIEGARWPFSGGMLEMLPATLALDSRQPRHLRFRVVGLEAGAFINTLELENISATGVFDGLLPMVFDQTGGRIEGGMLIARQQGDKPLYLDTTQGLIIPCDPTKLSGNLAYVGEVSNAQLGVYGKLAFDALKNLRYRCLAIMLDGAIDGEFMTQVRINGINQGTEEARKSFISRPFLGLPFIFNVRIEAPFRGLLNTATGLADPTKLISGSLGDQFRPVESSNGTNAVQPPDSK